LAILMLFNERETWTANELEANLGIELAELKDYLTSLYKGRQPILRERAIDKTRTVADKDGKQVPDMDSLDNLVFEVNKNLPKLCVKNKRPLSRISVAMPSSMATAGMVDPGGKKSMEEEILKERVHAMEALAVRAMKANRNMSMTDLNTQVCKEIARFVKADAKFVRKVIEDLIVRKFFERDDDDARRLVYIA